MRKRLKTRRRTLPKWIRVKYVTLLGLYLSFLVQTIFRQCFIYSYRLQTDTSVEAGDLNLPKLSELNSKIIGSLFYLGYASGHIPGGIVSDIYGGRYPLSIGIIVNSGITVFYPLVVVHAPWFFTGLMEFMIGFCEGFIIPAAYSIIARWVPDNQTTFVAGCLESSFYMGRIVMISTINYIAPQQEQWSHVFIFWGIFGICLHILILIFIYSTPKHSKMATQKEKNAMEAFVGFRFPKKINWKDILRDTAVWAITLQHITHKCMFYVLTGEVETIEGTTDKEEQIFQLTIVLWLIAISCCIFAFTVNHLINRRQIPRVYLRCTCLILGNCVACLPLLLKRHLKISTAAKFVLHATAFFLNGIHYAGGQVNVYDLTRLYCGSIVGAQNAFAGVGGYIFQNAASAVRVGTTDESNVLKWQNLYDITVCMCIMTTLLYSVWARAERADWDVIVEEEEDDYEED